MEIKVLKAMNVMQVQIIVHLKKKFKTNTFRLLHAKKFKILRNYQIIFQQKTILFMIGILQIQKWN